VLLQGVLKYAEERVKVPEDMEYCGVIKLVPAEFLTDVKVLPFRRHVADSKTTGSPTLWKM